MSSLGLLHVFTLGISMRGTFPIPAMTPPGHVPVAMARLWSYQIGKALRGGQDLATIAVSGTP